MNIGVLGLQGAFVAHQKAVIACGHQAVIIRCPEELQQIDGLILPGGESTTMGLLMKRFGLLEAIQQFAQLGKPILGTCAGMILLAKDIIQSKQHRLNLLDIAVHRNAFGRQLDSFKTQLSIPILGKADFPAVFIRAPFVEHILSNDVKILCEFEQHPILVQQNNMIAAAFHPELSNDLRLHHYFLQSAH